MCWIFTVYNRNMWRCAEVSREKQLGECRAAKAFWALQTKNKNLKQTKCKDDVTTVIFSLCETSTSWQRLACVILPYITKTRLHFAHSECNMYSVGNVCLVSNDKIGEKLRVLYQIVPLGKHGQKENISEFFTSTFSWLV